MSKSLKQKKGRSDSVLWQKPYTNRKCENQWTTQIATNKFDNITIADQLRMVSWSNNIHPTGNKVTNMTQEKVTCENDAE